MQTKFSPTDMKSNRQYQAYKHLLETQKCRTTDAEKHNTLKNKTELHSHIESNTFTVQPDSRSVEA